MVPLGSDFVGRDVLAGIVHGGRASLAVGAIAATLCLVIGVAVGAAAGFYGGLLDGALMRVTEFFQVLPALLFAMAVVSLFGPSLVTISVAIGVVGWPPVARLTRAEFLRIRELDYVWASRALGASDRRLIFRVILPNALAPLIVAATLTVGAAILFEAGLSFLGLGDPDTMSWGLMIGANRDFLFEAWWPVTLPGLAILATVLGVSLHRRRTGRCPRPAAAQSLSAPVANARGPCTVVACSLPQKRNDTFGVRRTPRSLCEAPRCSVNENSRMSCALRTGFIRRTPRPKSRSHLEASPTCSEHTRNADADGRLCVVERAHSSSTGARNPAQRISLASPTPRYRRSTVVRGLERLDVRSEGRKPAANAGTTS